MTNHTKLLPLPDWLDVEAKDLGSEEPFEFHRTRYYERAAWALSGAYIVVESNHTRYLERSCGSRINYGDLTPHECIARWAGCDAERWCRIDRSLRALGLENTAIESMDLGKLDDDDVLPVVSAYAFCKATPSQLYRALVNVGWDEWRADYNKRREAEEDSNE